MLIDTLKRRMFENDYTILQLAHEFHCSVAHLNRVINGKLPISERMEYKIRRFCGILNEPKKEGS